MIAIEGIDQSGKETQARMLTENLIKLGYNVSDIAFPDYSTPLGSQIKKFLAKKKTLVPEVRQLLYVANRYEYLDKLHTWLDNGVIVICDRYSESGYAYGMANGIELDWMEKLESGLPKADIVIFLDVAIDVAKTRKTQNKDLYERDLEFLKKCREAYFKLATPDRWFIIDGTLPAKKMSLIIKSNVIAYIKRREEILKQKSKYNGFAAKNRAKDESEQLFLLEEQLA